MRPTAAPVPTGIPRCDPHSLRIDPGDYQGAMGSLYGVVFLDNTSSRSCLVDGPFTARFITRSGRIALTTEVVPMPAEQSDPSTPGWAVAGRVRVEWEAFWCQADDPIVAIELVYAGVAFKANERPLVGGAVCDALGAHAGHASVWPFRPQPAPAPPPVPSVLRPTIEGPARVVAGTTLTYTVSLANTSSVEVRLDPCPNYSEWLLGRPSGTNFKMRIGGAREGHALNCTSLFSIPAGGTVSLEMRLRVPADALGSETLRWMLDDLGANQAAAPLEIEAAR